MTERPTMAPATASRPKDDGYRVPDPDAQRHDEIRGRLLRIAAYLRSDVDVAHVDPLALAELLEHTAAVYVDGVHARHQWPGHRQLVVRLVRADEPLDWLEQSAKPLDEAAPVDIGGSPGDSSDALELNGHRLFASEELCSTCRVARRRWPADHQLYSEGGSQCPWCVQADIEDEANQKRQEDK